MSEKYNGWTNYATWRINLELCDDIVSSLIGEQTFDDVTTLADYLKETCGEIVRDFDSREVPALTLSYAEAFLDQVNWYEIAEHAADDLVHSDDDDDEADDDEL